MSELDWPFKDPKRIPFEEKYRDLSKQWKINSSFVNYIIRLYTKKLEKELDALAKGTKKISLPKYFADRRTDSEYVYDLIDGWLIEDIVCDAWLKSRLEQIDPNIKIKHLGANRDREIQFNNCRKITTKPDFIYQTQDGKEVKVELQMARKTRTSYDMKESKIKRAIKDGNTIYLWVLLPLNKYFLLSPRLFESREPISNPRWGGKKVYTISVEEIKENKWGIYSMINPIPPVVYSLLGFSQEKK